MLTAKQASRLLAPLILCCTVPSCGFFDSRVEWRHGSYALLWIDHPNEVRLSYDMGRGSWARLIDASVFAVGADERYIVAKQHPGGNRLATHYFIVDLQVDSLNSAAVIGPLTAEEFAGKSQELQLPGFGKILESLQ